MVVAPAKKPQSVVEKMRQSIANAGNNKANIFFLKPNTKARFRFLKDMDKVIEVEFHENFDKNVGSPCALEYGKAYCEHCNNEEDPSISKTKTYYVWPIFVYNEEAKKGEPKGEVKLFRFRATSQSPLSWLLTYFDDTGSITSCDFRIERKGEALNTTYQVVPGKAEPFAVKGVKAPNKNEIMEILAKAYQVAQYLTPDEEVEDDEEETAEVEGPETEEEDVDPEDVPDTEDEEEETAAGDVDSEEDEPVKVPAKKAVVTVPAKVASTKVTVPAAKAKVVVRK